MLSQRILPLLVLIWVSASGNAGEREISATHRAASDSFIVEFASVPDSVGINTIHNWIVHVETTAGADVGNAQIAVSGGMPVHDHGLPTVPQVTAYLGDGNYLVEGMKFHMNGLWQVTLTISADGVEEQVTFDLEL